MKVGDWGPRAWESDEAADWFHRFWKDGWAFLQEEIDAFDPVEERFESLRAAAHVLACFGNAYMAPASVLERLPGLLDRTIMLLSAMIDPPGDDRAFLEICGDDPAIIADVGEQIAALRARRSELIR